MAMRWLVTAAVFLCFLLGPAAPLATWLVRIPMSPQRGCRVLPTPPGTHGRRVRLQSYNRNVYDDDGVGEAYAGALEGLRYFREYARRGMERFMKGDLAGCLADFDRAVASNSSQPLIQRGIALYIAGHYQNASLQLAKDVEALESSKLFKASDVRIWLSAAYNKLGLRDKAVRAVDNTYLTNTGLVEQRYIINATLDFYAGAKPLEDMLSIIDAVDDKDVFGIRFFGNFYLGLYFDSVGEHDLAKTFLAFTRESKRYPDRDMWYHVPRMLHTTRGWDDDPPS